MSQTEDRVASVLRGVAEPFLALVSAIALTLILTSPLVPTRTHLQVTLRPAVAADPVPHGQLEAEVEKLGLADEVQVLLEGGASRLVLKGVDDDDGVDTALADLLQRSGYQPDEPVRTEMKHVEAVLQPGQAGLPLAMTFQAVVYLAIGILLARRRVARDVFEVRVSRPRAALYGVGAGVAALILSSVLGLLLKLANLPVEEQSWLTDLFADPGMLALFSPFAVIVAPIAEEVFFRFYVFRFIATHAGVPAGLVISSLMFSVNHFHTPGLLIYLGIGCVFAWVYHRTGRLLAPIVGHATLNAVVLITAGLTSGVQI